MRRDGDPLSTFTVERGGLITVSQQYGLDALVLLRGEREFRGQGGRDCVPFHHEAHPTS